LFSQSTTGKWPSRVQEAFKNSEDTRKSQK